MSAPILRLAFQTDQNYVDGFVATLCGVLRHLPRATLVEVYLIDCGLQTDTRHRLTRFVALRLPRVTLTYLAVDPGVLDNLPLPEGLRHANRSVYARLFLPGLLPALDRILYLDCDLLVDADLSPLATLPLGGALVAAVPDAEQHAASTAAFNSGVMIMDLAALRAADVSARAVASAAAANPRHGDQTLLNELLRHRWLPLPTRWNRQVFLLAAFSVFRTEPASVWHIYMGRKPWHFHRAHARGLVAEYYDLLASAGWVSTSAPGFFMHTSASRDRLKSALATLRRAVFRFR